jgi:HJR/Mrr/RecB family endonuclease
MLTEKNYRFVRDLIQVQIIRLAIDASNIESKKDDLLRLALYESRDYGLKLYGRASSNPYATARSIDSAAKDTHALKALTIELVEEAIADLKEFSDIEGDLEFWQLRLAGKWIPLAPKPKKANPEMSPLEAEEYACQFLLFYGAEGARVTRYSQDGGIDVESHQLVAQVKHQKAPIGVKVIRETFAVAIAKNKAAVVFGKSGFTSEARRFATENDILLFSYYPTHEGYTSKASKVLVTGFSSW